MVVEAGEKTYGSAINLSVSLIILLGSAILSEGACLVVLSGKAGRYVFGARDWTVV